jgi:hypothetical protein
MRAIVFALCILLLAIPICLSAQDSTSSSVKIVSFPEKFIQSTATNVAKLENKLDRHTEKYLKKLSRQESKIKKQLYQFDSSAAKTIFYSHSEDQYAALLQKLLKDSSETYGKVVSGNYFPFTDSLQTAFSFLKQNPQVINIKNLSSGNIRDALHNINRLESKMQDADQIVLFVQQRKEQIKRYLSNYTKVPNGLMKAYSGYYKQAFYYSEQLKAYKEELNDPKKVARTAFMALSKIPAFQDFMKRNSLLFSAFNLSGTYNPTTTALGLSIILPIFRTIWADC